MNQRDYTKRWRANNPWMSSYSHAKDRCGNKNNGVYHRYGGRGIKMLLSVEEIKCLWFRDKAFDMDKPSIDRINNDKNYSMDNCRFIEQVENNRRSGRITRRKPIIQKDLKGNVIRVWESAYKVYQSIGLPNTRICACCRGGIQTAGGFKWEYR